VLLGAVVAAYAPSLAMRVVRRPDAPGLRFELALALLRELDRARAAGKPGLPLATLAARLRTDPLQLEPVLDRLIGLDWVARLAEGGEPRCVLLCDPEMARAAALVDALLLAPGGEASQALRQAAGLAEMPLAKLLK
jgi:membrane protein